MSRLLLAKSVHDELCPSREVDESNVCRLCGYAVDLSRAAKWHIEIGVEDKIPLKGQ